MDAITGQELTHIDPNPSHGWDRVAWSPDGQRIVSGDSSGMNAPVVWDAQSGKVLLTLQLEAGGTNFIWAAWPGRRMAADHRRRVADGSIRDE